ncbi:hypothetical protein FKW77_003988 [Venturia effusa]|uniref:Uncharacterized protein n=1 Tax=Venturia effusa TaxID=50376 RepID=A0A517L921_9PEZI|nr:hypothetical protein FKW77_003988 [Venturia effusa]
MSQTISKAAPKSGLVALLVFCAIAGPYTYLTAKKEGADMDAARHRFQTAKQRNDLRISGGAPILHLDEEAAHLPSVYKGPAALAQWR